MMRRRNGPGKRAFEKRLVNAPKIVKAPVADIHVNIRNPLMPVDSSDMAEDLTDERLETRIRESPVLYRYPGLKDSVLELLRRFHELKDSSQDYSEI